MNRLCVVLAGCLYLAPIAAFADPETEAMIKELQAQKKDATPEMQKLLDQQIEALRNASKMLEDATKSGARAPNVPLAPAMKGFFTPAKAAAVPAWIPDTAERSTVKNADLKCPSEAKVYADETSMSCAISAGKGKIPVPHGITVLFYSSTGKIKSQGVYEKGLLRWTIEYHASGGRHYVTFYDDVEPKVHRENGTYTRYADNGTGNVTSQAEYKSGVLHGWQKLWEPDGTPIVATRYENGKAVEETLPDGSKKPLK